jgi:hypothetical protein
VNNLVAVCEFNYGAAGEGFRFLRKAGIPETRKRNEAGLEATSSCIPGFLRSLAGKTHLIPAAELPD